MNRTRSRSPLLLPQNWGLGGLLLAATLFPAPAVRAQTVTVTVTDLNSDAYYASDAFGVSASQQVGFGYGPSTGYQYQALLWSGTADSVVNLTPAGYTYTGATGVADGQQVGFGVLDNSGGKSHAFLWTGTAASAVDLNPAGFSDAVAKGVSGGVQVGYAYKHFSPHAHAFLWTGTAASALDLNPAGYAFSEANGIDGDTQVGIGSLTLNTTHALLWHGTAGSVVDLNPTGFTHTESLGVSGSQQVGYGFGAATGSTPDGGIQIDHALLWTGTSASVVDLHPSGYYDSQAESVSGGVQVGYADVDATFDTPHAFLWTGTATSAIDLQQFLPLNLRMDSHASGVSVHGNIVDVVGQGTGYDNGDEAGPQDAVVWHIVFPSKPTVFHLDPASRTAGRAGFTLAVNGSSFTANSVILWNGAAQSTMFVSPFEITADIPASLIANVGTAQVAVRTSGTTSNAHALTIMPRPTVASLSPTSKAAGSAAFTLTVTGTGFRPASFYAPTVAKWNGTALATTYVSGTTLTAQVPASLLTKSGKATVTVTTPDVATSAGQTFTITP